MNRDPIPLVIFWRWLTRLPLRLDCWVRPDGHLWVPDGMYHDQCLSCGKRRPIFKMKRS